MNRFFIIKEKEKFSSQVFYDWYEWFEQSKKNHTTLYNIIGMMKRRNIILEEDDVLLLKRCIIKYIEKGKLKKHRRNCNTKVYLTLPGKELIF